MKKEYTVTIFASIMVTVLAFIIVCNSANAQDNTRPLNAKDLKTLSESVQNKIDKMWIYVTSLNVTDCGDGEFDNDSYFDTIYTNIKFDTILYVGITKDTTDVNTWTQTFAWSLSNILSDSSIAIERRLKYDDFDDYHWIVVGRGKRP